MDHILPLSLSDWVYYRVGTPSLLIGGGDESALCFVLAGCATIAAGRAAEDRWQVLADQATNQVLRESRH